MPEKEEKKSGAVAIILAVVGLLGTLGTAYINGYFASKKVEAVKPATSTSSGHLVTTIVNGVPIEGEMQTTSGKK